MNKTLITFALKMPYKDPEKRKAYHREYLKKWTKENLEKRRAYGRKSMQKWREENPEESAQRMKDWRSKNKKRHLDLVNNYKKNNPEKAAAHEAVKKAIKDGRLKRQPCEKCGKMRSQAHHEDYSKPLNVIWLCQKHHSEVHKKAQQYPTIAPLGNQE